MAITEKLFDALSKLNLSGYEWRILMVILARTYGNGKKSCSLTLDYFVEKTKIKKPHVCNALSSIEERNVINVISIRSIKSYSLQEDSSKWRSDLSIKLSSEDLEKYNNSFDEWFRHYPNQIYEEDSRILYLNLISDGVKPEELNDAVLGLVNERNYRSKKMNQDFDKFFCPYPTTFLKNNKWRGYLQYKNMDWRKAADPETYVGEK